MLLPTWRVLSKGASVCCPPVITATKTLLRRVKVWNAIQRKPGTEIFFACISTKHYIFAVINSVAQNSILPNLVGNIYKWNKSTKMKGITGCLEKRILALDLKCQNCYCIQLAPTFSSQNVLRKKSHSA